jgi:hypothetical protein
MRYRTKGGKILTDGQVLLDASRGLSRTGRTTGFFVYIFNLLTGAISLVNKLLFRYKLGVRTYGFFTLLFSLVFVYSVGLYHYSLQSITSGEENIGQVAPEGFFQKIGYFLSGIFNNILALFTEQSTYIFGGLRETHYGEDRALVILLVVLVIFYFSQKIADNQLREAGRKEELVHSLYRGESFFLRLLVGKKVGEKKIDGDWITYVGDSFIVLFMSSLLYEVEYIAVSQILLVSQCFLLIEDYRIYKQEKNIKYEFVDGQMDSLYMLELQEEYERGEVQVEKYIANSDVRSLSPSLKKDFSKSTFRASI